MSSKINFYSTKKTFHTFPQTLKEAGIVPASSTHKPKSQVAHFENMYQYFIRKGRVQKQDVNELSGKLLNGIKNPELYLTNPQNWISPYELSALIYNSHQVFPDLSIYDWFEIGQSFQYSKSPLVWLVGTNTIGIRGVFDRIEEINSQQNTYTQLERKRFDKTNADFYMHYDEDVNAITPGVAPHYFAGVISIAPLYDGYEKSVCNIPFNQMPLKNIFMLAYKNAKFKTHFDKEGNLYYEGRKISERVPIKDFEYEEEVAKWLEHHSKEKDNLVDLIIEPIISFDDKIYLKKGECFGCPFSLLKANWGERSFAKKMKLFLPRSKKQREKAFIELNKHYTNSAREGAILAKELETARARGNDNFVVEISRMIHDIKNVLTPVSMGTELSQGYLEDIIAQLETADTTDNLEEMIKPQLATTHKNVSVVNTSVKHVVEILESFRERVSYQRENKTRELFANKLINSVYSAHQNNFKESSIKANLNLGDNLPNINARPSDIYQVVNELITNSIKAIKDTEQKEIAVYTYFKDNNLCIEVADSGHGIEQEDMANVFNESVRIRENREGQSHGMSSVATIIQGEYNGHIEIESDGEGKGAVFRVLIPVEQ
jgi:signal transduction histidine kinase